MKQDRAYHAMGNYLGSQAGHEAASPGPEPSQGGIGRHWAKPQQWPQGTISRFHQGKSSSSCSVLHSWASQPQLECLDSPAENSEWPEEA